MLVFTSNILNHEAITYLLIYNTKCCGIVCINWGLQYENLYLFTLMWIYKICQFNTMISLKDCLVPINSWRKQIFVTFHRFFLSSIFRAIKRAITWVIEKLLKWEICSKIFRHPLSILFVDNLSNSIKIVNSIRQAKRLLFL